MSELIDLALVTDALRLLERLLERHGINWFLARDGARLMALDPSKIDLVVQAALKSRERAGRPALEGAVDYCRKQVKRTLIREVAQAMIATGC